MKRGKGLTKEVWAKDEKSRMQLYSKGRAREGVGSARVLHGASREKRICFHARRDRFQREGRSGI